MNIKRVVIVCGVIFLIFNSLFLVRNLIPGLTNSSLDLDQDVSTYDIDYPLFDFEKYEDRFYGIARNSSLGDFWILFGYDDDMTQIFNISLYSVFPLKINLVNENGLIIGSENNLFDFSGFIHVTLDGELTTELVPSTLFTYPYNGSQFPLKQIFVTSNSVYVLVSIKNTGRFESGGYEQIELFDWDFNPDNELEKIATWEVSDLGNTYYLTILNNNEDLSILQFLSTSALQGKIFSYDLGESEIGDAEEVSSYHPLEEVDSIEVLSEDEIFAINEIGGFEFKFIVKEMSSGSTFQYEQESDTTALFFRTLNIISAEDLLIITGTIPDAHSENPVMFSFNKRGNTILTNEFDLNPYLPDGFSGITTMDIFDGDLHLVVTTYFGEVKLLIFNDAYSTQILLEGVPEILQFNFLSVLFSLLYVGYKFYFRSDLEIGDDLEYPVHQEDDSNNDA